MLKIMEKLNNMTCGECKYHKNMSCHLPQRTFIIVPEEDACRHFEQKPKMTNGDRIRSMSDEELAELFVYFKRRTTDEDVYGSILFKQIPFEGKQKAIEATLEELKKGVENDCKI